MLLLFWGTLFVFTVVFFFFLLSQSSANNHMEEDKWQHPQKGTPSQVTSCTGDSQYSAGGFRNLWMQSWEPERRNCFQRASAGLQWVYCHFPFFFLYIENKSNLFSCIYFFVVIWYACSGAGYSDSRAPILCWSVKILSAFVQPSCIIQEQAYIITSVDIFIPRIAD